MALLESKLEDTGDNNAKQHHKLALIAVRRKPEKYLSELLYDWKNDKYRLAIEKILTDLDRKNTKILDAAFSIYEEEEKVPHIIKKVLENSHYNEEIVKRTLGKARNRGCFYGKELTLIDNLEVIKENQELIRKAIDSEDLQESRLIYFSYLDFREKINNKYINNITDFSYIYKLLKNKIFINDITEYKQFNVR